MHAIVVAHQQAVVCWLGHQQGRANTTPSPGATGRRPSSQGAAPAAEAATQACAATGSRTCHRSTQTEPSTTSMPGSTLTGLAVEASEEQPRLRRTVRQKIC